MAKNLQKFVLFIGLLLSIAWSCLAWEINRFGELDEAQPADAIVVLGAGVWRGRPSPVFRERINHGILLYEQGYAEKLIFTGGIGNRDTLSEAAVAREYAIENGVPSEAILIEETSTSTIENLQNAQMVAAENGVDSFLIVSTPFHMKRAMQITADLDMEAYTSPTRSIQWINPITKFRSLVQETISYLRFMWFTREELVG